MAEVEVKMEPVEGAVPPKAANPLARPTLKLPPKTGVTGAFKPGLNLPPKAGVTGAFKPGLKLPAKPVIRKPGATVVAKPLPKPTLPKPIVTSPAADAAAGGAAEVKPLEQPVAEVVKPVAPPAVDIPKPVESLKAVTQKLKGITQQIPQQAILRKTGIIADEAMTESQKEAAKHKTARISLSDAMGVAPVKNENAPMKTIRIKRPIDIPGATKPLPPQARPDSSSAAAPVAPVSAEAAAPVAEAPVAGSQPSTTITQRKTLKISRPGVVRPAGKFGLKNPTPAAAATSNPVSSEAGGSAVGGAEISSVGDIADIQDIPSTMPVANLPLASTDNGPAWLWTLSTLVQAAACVAIGALAWFLYQNTQISYF